MPALPQSGVTQADIYGHGDDFWPEYTIVETYRNWPIRQRPDGQLYVKVDGVEVSCVNIKDAKKEIDKAIKRWNKLARERRIAS